eukprot:4995083-Karenia_brevis.AAC.1
MGSEEEDGGGRSSKSRHKDARRAKRGQASTLDPNLLLQVELLKAVKKLGKKDSSGSDSDDGEDDHTSKAKNFGGIHKLRRRLKKHPRKCTAAFRERVKKDLSIRNDLQPWTYMDWSMKHVATFGKMRGLWKAMYGMTE